jgi:hypothetical protein
VKPFGKGISVSMECRVVDIKETGSEGGAPISLSANPLLHIKENILTPEKRIDTGYKLNLVARMGGIFIAALSGNACLK